MELLKDADMPCVEPVQRKCAGRYGWVVHRFPIRGGRTLRDTVYKDIAGVFAEAIFAEASRPSLFRRFIYGQQSIIQPRPLDGK